MRNFIKPSVLMLFVALCLIGSFVSYAGSPSPVVGNINGIKISVPNYYVYGPVQYEGENIWSGKPRTFTPSFDSKIEDFAILLRLSNLQPIRTAQDKEDYSRSGRTVVPGFYETWTTIGFSPKGYWTDNDAVKYSVQRWEKDEPHWGPFTKNKERMAGLVEEDTVQTNLSDFAHPNYDFYYDDKTFNTFIRCQTMKQVVSPYAVYTSCSHLFVVPELKVVAEAIYSKTDLMRWHEIEEESKKIIHSFIVQSGKE